MIFRPETKKKSELRNTEAQILAARERLGKILGLKHRIGIIRLWPDQACAEHENVERIRTAAALIGVDILELDRNGYVLDAPGGMVMVTREDVDFVLHLHYETSKAYDVPSIAAMWNPIDFYFEWGFETYWANQMSHDLFAWTGSKSIQAMIAQERGVDVAARMPLLNHTLAEPIFVPRERSKLEIFYCGINWEKISGKPGRHDTILRALDKAGKLALYGPEEIQGVKVWDGYKSYRGSLPFDGRTVIEKIADAGACLVFSSDAHKTSDIMSNRLFEALSGGAVVIGDEHPFIEHAIGENYIKIPSDLPIKERAKLVLGALEKLQKNPAMARDLAQNAQDMFVGRYLLCGQLVNLFETYADFRKRQETTLKKIASKTVLDVIAQPQGINGDKVIAKLTALTKGFGASANIILLCSYKHEQWYKTHCGNLATIVAVVEDEHDVLTPADIARAVRPHLRSKKLWLTSLTEDVFYAPMLNAVDAFEKRKVGRLGHLLCHADQAGVMHHEFRSGHLAIERAHDSARSAFIFDTDWLLATIHPAHIGWRHCVRIAELAEEGISFDQLPSVRIHLKSYEYAVAEGYRENSTPGGAELASRIGEIRSYTSETCSVKRYAPRPIDYSLDSGELVFSASNMRRFSSILGRGWHNAELEHVWSSGVNGDLWLRIRPSMKRLRIHFAGNPHVEDGTQSVEILVNMTPVVRTESRLGDALVVDLDIATSPWISDELNQVTFRAKVVAVPPLDTGDTRALGICLRKLEVG